MKPRLLDLCCGAGGCSVGYARAGFDPYGVDHRPQRHYPYWFVQADGLLYLERHGREFDAIHVSPPCQGYSVTSSMRHTRAFRGEVPMLIDDFRALLQQIGRPWIIENVTGARAHMRAPIMLCGLMFGLRMFRHRLFEGSVPLLVPDHPSHSGHRVGEDGMVCMCGHGDSGRGRTPNDHRNLSAWKRASRITWMTRDEMSQAIPPDYTQWIGKHLMEVIE
jgi:DNA (cytosine-5)-methyltransferase 1